MKAKDIVIEATLPDRIRLGIKNQTAPNPARLVQKGYSNHIAAKNADQHKFASNIQRRNYMAIKDILKRNGLQFSHFFASTYRGGADYNRRHGSFDYNTGKYTGGDPGANLETFIGVVGDINNPQFVWYKYEGNVAGGGRNMVFAGGKGIKTTDLLSMNTVQQNQFVKAPAQGVYTPKSSASPKVYVVRVALVHPAWNTSKDSYFNDPDKDSKYRKVFFISKLTARNTTEAEKIGTELVQKKYSEKIAQLLKQGFEPADTWGRFGTRAWLKN